MLNFRTSIEGCWGLEHKVRRKCKIGAVVSGYSVDTGAKAGRQGRVNPEGQMEDF